MSWISLLLAGLQLSLVILKWLRSRADYDTGRDAEIAAVAAAILDKTLKGREVMAQVMGMSDAQVDKALKDLEP